MFRHQKVRVQSTNVDAGDNIPLFTVRAADYMDTSDGDADTDVADGIAEPVSTISQGEQWCLARGPVTIHGYSVRLFGNFFGVVFQGLSRYDDSTTANCKGNITSHIFHEGFDTSVTSETDLDEESAIKNVKYLRGWSAKVGDVGQTSAGISQTLGSVHLQKKFTRKTFKHKSKGNFRKVSKNGFVLVPNTDTEFFSLNVKPMLESEDNRSYYADISVWMSSDQV